MVPLALASADLPDRPDRPDGAPDDGTAAPEPSAEPGPGPETRLRSGPAPRSPAEPDIPPPGLDDLAPPRAHRPPPAPQRRAPVQRVVLALLLIAAAGLIGYILSRPGEAPGGPDVLARSVEAAGDLRHILGTDQPAEAQQFVRDEFGWRVGVPTFATATLRGVAIARTAPAVEVPVFLYADGDGRDVAVFAYSYALLDQVPDRLTLARADYDELDVGVPVVRRVGGTGVLLWRDRDDIYVAVTDLPPAVLQEGLLMER